MASRSRVSVKRCTVAGFWGSGLLYRGRVKGYGLYPDPCAATLGGSNK